MRYFFIFIFLLLAVIGSFFVYSSNAANQLTRCYFKGGQTIENIHYKSQKGDLDDYDKCVETKKVVDEIGVCYQLVKDMSYVPIDILETLTYVMNPEFQTYSYLVEVHNESCPYLSVEIVSPENDIFY